MTLLCVSFQGLLTQLRFRISGGSELSPPVEQRQPPPAQELCFWPGMRPVYTAACGSCWAFRRRGRPGSRSRGQSSRAAVAMVIICLLFFVIMIIIVTVVIIAILILIIILYIVIIIVLVIIDIVIINCNRYNHNRHRHRRMTIMIMTITMAIIIEAEGHTEPLFDAIRQPLSPSVQHACLCGDAL